MPYSISFLFSISPPTLSPKLLEFVIHCLKHLLKPISSLFYKMSLERLNEVFFIEKVSSHSRAEFPPYWWHRREYSPLKHQGTGLLALGWSKRQQNLWGKWQHGQLGLSSGTWSHVRSKDYSKHKRLQAMALYFVKLLKL